MILVTGATGQTGREVVRELLAAGARVRALARDPLAAAGILGSGVEIVAGDFERPETLIAAFAAVEKLFLLTPVDPRQVEQQGRAVELAQQVGVRHIVKLSVLGADLDSPIALARWHAQTEQQIEESGVPFTHLRPHWYMQNTLSFAATIRAEGRLYAPMKDGRISTVDCRDVAAVAATVLLGTGHEGKVYDITGGEALSFHDVARQIATATGQPVEYIDVPPAEAEKSMVAAGLPDWLADALNGLYGIFSAGHASQTSRVVEDLVGRPARTYAEFAREHAETFSTSA